MLSFGVLIAFLSPKQSEIKESSLESISKSIIQGVWDPAHSTRTGIIAHSTRVGITSGCRHYTKLPPLHPTAAITLGYPPLHPAAATFHPDVSHPKFYCRRHFPFGCLTSRILLPDGRGERFNFPGQTYPDPLIALTPGEFRSHFAQCRGVLLKLPDMCARHFKIF